MNLTAVRKPAVERRPVVRNVVQRSAAAVATPTPARALQNRVGNRAMQAVVAPLIQTAGIAARVSKPTDAAEKEAEASARHVERMSQPAPAAPSAKMSAPPGKTAGPAPPSVGEESATPTPGIPSGKQAAVVEDKSAAVAEGKAGAAEVSAPSRSTAPGPGAPSGKQAAVAKDKPTAGARGKAAAAKGEEAGAKGEARPVAGGEAEAPAKKKAPSAREAVAPTAAAVRHRATGARTHSKADIPVGSAQAAALTPATERTRGAAQATVAGMDAADADRVRREAFKASLKAAIEKATPQPKTEDEAERVQKQGAAQASSALRGELTTQRDAAAGPMKAAAKTEVAPGSQPALKEATLEPEPMGKAPAPVSGASVVPEPLPAEQLDYSSDREPTDRAMADAGVTKEQLDKGNEPQFGPTLKARSDAEKHEASVETKYRASEGKVQGTARVAAEAELAKGIGGMHEVRGTRVGKVVAQQNVTQARNAAERKRVTDTITGIKDKTKSDVDLILKDMDDEASKVFEAGLAEAERVYEQVFEDEKGGVGTWLTTWGSDWEELIERSLGKARQAYLARVDVAIDDVATCVDAKLAAAKKRVADGRKEVETFVAGLDASVKGFGKEALESVSADFDALETDIDQRRDALIDKLAEQYKASYERMSAMEEKLREENKSLWQRVYDATVGLIKKILAFKDMLLSILAKAADVISDIISDPIGFLGNLIDGVMLGLKNFMGNIAAHLKKGLLDWLFGALGGAGLQLPDTLDLKGIVSIVLQVLGLTYANFRARAVKIVGEPVVAALEQTAEVFKIVITEGIPGLWRFIKEKLADLKSMVLDAIFDFIKEKVIIAGVTWVIGLLNPASAFFKACKAIYDIVMFFIERGSQIIELVNAVIDSMASIAKGNIAVAAKFVENALAKAIPVAIGFLASLLGLGDISGTIRKTIEKAQEPINKAIDWVIDQAVKLVKAAGKFIGKLFGKKEDPALANKEPSDQVRSHALDLVFVRLKTDHTREQAAVIIRGIETELRPMGLKSLEIGPENEEGTSPVVAEASAKKPLANLTSGVPRPKGRSVTSKVQLELTVPEETPATEIAPADPARATVRIGGVAWSPAVHAAHKLNVVTWNTSNIDAPGNTSHAEHQFVTYMESRRQLWANVDKITIVNVTRSPCSECGPELASLLEEIKKARAGQPVTAVIYWTKLHSTGAQPTSWETLHRMQRAGWVLNAPADALPPEKTVHSDLVHVEKA